MAKTIKTWQLSHSALCYSQVANEVISLLEMFIGMFRFIFLPLFLFCNIPRSEDSISPTLFESDTAYIVIMMLFSISNGYVGTICMMSGPQMVDGEEAGTAASMLVACLGLGLGTGSFLSNFFPMLI